METKFKVLSDITWYMLTEKEARHAWDNIPQLEIYRLYEADSESLIEDDEEFHEALIDGSVLAIEAKYRENL
jgi:hypothetical protein